MYGNQPYNELMSPTLKSERIELRVTSEQKSTIEQAATISGRSVTDFSVSLLVEQAAEVIRHDRELHMSAQAWDEFNAILERPAQSISGLAELISRPSVFTD